MIFIVLCINIFAWLINPPPDKTRTSECKRRVLSVQSLHKVILPGVDHQVDCTTMARSEKQLLSFVARQRLINNPRMTLSFLCVTFMGCRFQAMISSVIQDYKTAVNYT